MAPRRAVRSSAVTKTWARAWASAAAARALPLILGCRCLLDAAGPDGGRCEIGLRSRARGPGQGWLSAPAANAPGPPLARQMADPRTSALGHGEQASQSPAQGGPVRSGGVLFWPASKPGQQGTAIASALQWLRSSDGGQRRPGWPGRASGQLEVPAGKRRSCIGEALATPSRPMSRQSPRIARQGQACGRQLASGRSGPLAHRTGQVGEQPGPPSTASFQGNGIGA